MYEEVTQRFSKSLLVISLGTNVNIWREANGDRYKLNVNYFKNKVYRSLLCTVSRRSVQNKWNLLSDQAVT
jgi:hypothetical protein